MTVNNCHLPEMQSSVIYSRDAAISGNCLHRLTVIATHCPCQQLGVIRAFLPPMRLTADLRNFESTQYLEQTSADTITARADQIFQQLFTDLVQQQQYLEALNG